MTREQAKAALLLLANALLETVQEAGPNGAPSGPMYMAVMTKGVSLDMYQQIMSALVATGKVRLSGHVYYAVKQ